MVTIKEVLSNSGFDSVRVLAGHDGLSRPVRAVHKFDSREAAEMRLDSTLILLPIGELPDDNESQIRLVHALDMQLAAGLILIIDNSSGQSYKSSDYSVSAADEDSFPIIVAYSSFSPNNLEYRLQSHIVGDETDMVQSVFDIHRQLSALVLEGGDIDTLAKLLAQLIHCPVTIETPEMRVLAHAEYGGKTDEAREASIRDFRTPTLLREVLDENDELELLRRARYPVVLKPRPEAGMTLQRIVAPILVGDELYGYMWIIADDRPLTRADNLALEGAAIIAALIMLRDRMAETSKERLRQEILQRLLEDDLEKVRELLPQVRQFGLDLGQPSQILICTWPEKVDFETHHRLKKVVSESLFHLSLRGLVADTVSLVVTLFASNSRGLPGRHMVEALLDRYPDLRIALSDPCLTIGDIQYAYSQMRDALLISTHLGFQDSVITAKDIGYLNLLSKVPHETVIANPYFQHILSLVAYDEQHRADLLITLETYLEQGGNSSHTAELLSVHRGTVHYRLNNIAELLKVDLSDPLVNLNLIVALKLFRLHDLEI